MLNLLKKWMSIFRKLLHCCLPFVEEQPNDAGTSQSPSAEGWELVDDFNHPANPSHPQVCPPEVKGTAPTDGKTARLKSSMPPYPVIWVYFTANGYPESEAIRFYKRYQVIGWNAQVIPALDHWQQLADHWIQQARQSPRHNKPKPPSNDHPSGSDNNPAAPV